MATSHKPPQIGDYHGWRIATADCLCLTDRDYDVRGVRIWMSCERYYVIVGVPLFVGDAMAESGCRASNVSKDWNQGWAPHTTGACDAAGYTAADGNIYYVNGNGETCVRALWDFCERVEKAVLDKGYGTHRWYRMVMYSQIMKALELHDPTWRDSEDNVNRRDEAARAKDVVRHVPGFRILRDGTTLRDNGWGFYE